MVLLPWWHDVDALHHGRPPSGKIFHSDSLAAYFFCRRPLTQELMSGVRSWKGSSRGCSNCQPSHSTADVPLSHMCSTSIRHMFTTSERCICRCKVCCITKAVERRGKMREGTELMCWMGFATGCKSHFYLVLFWPWSTCPPFCRHPCQKYISIDPLFQYQLCDSMFHVPLHVSSPFRYFTPPHTTNLNHSLIHVLWSD